MPNIVRESIEFTRGEDPKSVLKLGIYSLRPFSTKSFYEFVQAFNPTFGIKILNNAAKLLNTTPNNVRFLTNEEGDLIEPGPAEAFRFHEYNEFLEQHNLPKDEIIKKFSLNSKIDLEFSKYGIVYVYYPWIKYILGV